MIFNHKNRLLFFSLGETENVVKYKHWIFPEKTKTIFFQFFQLLPIFWFFLFFEEIFLIFFWFFDFWFLIFFFFLILFFGFFFWFLFDLGIDNRPVAFGVTFVAVPWLCAPETRAGSRPRSRSTKCRSRDSLCALTENPITPGWTGASTPVSALSTGTASTASKKLSPWKRANAPTHPDRAWPCNRKTSNF